MVKARVGTAFTTFVFASILLLGTTSGARGEDGGADIGIRQEIAQATSTTTTTTTETTTQSNSRATTTRTTNSAPAASDPVYATSKWHRKRMSRLTAIQMAKENFFDVTAAADPELVSEVCRYKHAAEIIAAHRRISQIADADHYLCRRLTRWPSAAAIMIANPNVEHVLTLDPQGVYYAIEREPALSRELARHVMFQDMLTQNPDLGRVVAANMHVKKYMER